MSIGLTELLEALDYYNEDPEEVLTLISEDVAAAERLECALYDLAELIEDIRLGVVQYD